MPKDELFWSAWCSVCRQTVAEAAGEQTVRAAWFAHAEEMHPSASVLALAEVS